MTNFEEELKNHGTVVYTNKGISMMPLLRQGKDIMIIRAKDEPLKKNDAVLFKRANGQYVLHRITRVREDGIYYIIGDNCSSGEWVAEEQILGVLTQVQRDGKILSCTDPKYLRYVRSVPWRRAVLTPARYCRGVLSKVYHLFFKRKKS